MERANKEKRVRKKAPRVPIKTYKWEDVRRSRQRGGYPWTYLYKEPYADQTDPKFFKMDKKAASLHLPQAEELEIREITNGSEASLTPEPSSCIVITELPSDLESHSNKAAESVAAEDVTIESAESSDNISQYLDKEEPPEPGPATENRQERAKSEEPKRKRKHSIESSYSRKSLSKLAFLKKLKEIKVPKLNLPSLPNLSKKPEEEVKKPKAQTKSKEPQPSVAPNAKPVYIHIPLKPPEGETDEFSYLEFGEKKPEEPKKELEVPPEPPSIEISERRFSGDPDEIVAFEIVKSETIDLDHAAKNGLQGGSDYLIIEQEDDNKSESRSMIIIMPNEETPSSAPLSRSGSRKTPSRQGSRKARAKSAEPERKRKLSAESSYSRISLSKLGLLKKLKDAKDKITNFSRTNSKKKAKEPIKKTEEKKTEPSTSKNEPKYIHIPLKPPPGKTDEYSYLENESKTAISQTEKTVVEQSSVESAGSPKADGVQFIFLTPPSDDEFLVQPDIPETPEEKDPGRITELKKLAKDAADKASPEARKKLQAVAEEEAEDDKTKKSDDTSEAQEEGEKKDAQEEREENILVDEEDGLKTTTIVKEEEDQVKSSLKTDGSPVLKKKVSFKRRSRDESKDPGYEEIQAPNETKNVTDDNKAKLAVMGTSQSMSADEEKSYLDEQKIIKSSSLEEDYNRWSKLSDHDYEPVNPPADNPSPIIAAPRPTPTVHVIDTDRGISASSTSLEKRMLEAPEQTAENFQAEIETKYFQPPTQTTITTVTTTTQSSEPKPEGPNRFQQAIKTQTDKFKTKLHDIKRPNIKLPPKPTFNFPKIPDTAKITLPSFSLPRRKRSLKQRQYSTESNAGGSKKNYFDFRTYPRLFKKKPKEDLDNLDAKPEQGPEFATVPRTKRKVDDRWGGSDSIRVPLHSEDSIEDQPASHIRYEPEIDIDDAYEKENQEIHAASAFSHSFNSRWNHGSFHPQDESPRNEQVTDLDSPVEETPHESFDANIHSSESSLGMHRRGVLEEIDSDEFFLRQKGISQDNMYLSSEIREALKAPSNALADLQNLPNEFRASNQSLPETPSKRKSAKKPKRKKTPHVSQEHISFDQDSELDNELPPFRPKRRSKRSKKKNEEGVVPYQETIAVEEQINVLLNERPEEISNPYEKYDSEEEKEPPLAPPRRHRSLNFSEQDSILGDVDPDRDFPLDDIELYKTEAPPVKPPRTLSRSSSKSHEEPPIAPTRTRSHSKLRSRAESLEEPCVEEICVQDFRDHMGYAIVDKNVKREPPLPPPRTPPRKKSLQSMGSEKKFSTVPRPFNEPPVRPLRNYSTLGPSRPPRKKPTVNMTDEEKENIDIIQYIEIEDEGKDLQSGEVIQKMRDRPLPAPPRPPRKARTPDLSEGVEETEVSTQTEPLPDDVVCEPTEEPVVVEKRLLTPTHYSFEETITHGSLIVEPLNGAKLLPESEIERIVPIGKDYEDETSSIPEEFTKLKTPEPRPVAIQADPEVEVLKAQKLQVTDLDVDRLSVNELLASRIVVSEIDSGSIQTNEIGSRSGTIKVGDIELPPALVQQLFERLQSQESEAEPGQKKTPIEPAPDSVEGAAPKAPERRMHEPEVDEEPPPRPPEPFYLSQPPPSFYALRAQHYVEEAAPLAPRRRRQPKPPVSSSDDSSPPQLARRRFRSPEPSIPQLTGQLLQACGTAANSSIKRLIAHITNNVLRNADGQQDLHVVMVMLLILIAGLILLGYGDGKTVHHHHWEFFNPPKDL